MAKKLLIKSDSFYDIYERKPGCDKITTHYCPGCEHGNLHKLIGEALEDFGVKDRTIMISPVGCSVFLYYYFDTGNIQVAHDRAPSVATGLKRANPDSIIISYQGDGDLAAIGGNNILQAANRGENITVFFVNNAIYGMTGGQMAPTSLIGQKTATTPYGRTVQNDGHPIRVSELLATLESPVYIERTAMIDTKSIAKTRSAVRKAIKCQIDNKGFSLVEVLATCPSGWKTTPLEALTWLKENMLPYFKLGVFKDKIAETEPTIIEKKEFSPAQIQELLEVGQEKAPAKEIGTGMETIPNPRFKIAGFGGQGVLLLGEVLCEAGMIEERHVSWLPSYGPEMRGGTANCHVILSKKEIGSPIVSTSDILIALNQPSLMKFGPDVVDGGIIFYNSSLIKEKPNLSHKVEWIPIPAAEMAEEVGTIKASNMVMLALAWDAASWSAKKACSPPSRRI